MKLSVIVPAYNEADTLKKTIPELHSYLKSLKMTFELIVADDGSTDDTRMTVSALAKKHKNIIYTGYHANKGKGATLTNAFKKAKGDYQLFIDADLTIEKSLIAILLRALANNDIAIASKHTRGAKVAYPLGRKIASSGFSKFARMLFHVPVGDYQCGLKAFRKNVIKDLLPSITSQGFLWDTEILARAYRKHYKIAEIPAIVHPEEGRASKVRIFRDPLRMFRGLLALSRAVNENR